jgi:hypothetical protein
MTLTIDKQLGIAFQAGGEPFDYGASYFAECVRRANTDIGHRLNAIRLALTERYCTKLLDFGIGSGAFIEASRLPALGFDINPLGVLWLSERLKFVDVIRCGVPRDVDGVTLWDVLEHMPEPIAFLKIIPAGVVVFTSLPVLTDIGRVKESKHYKPNEHLWYFTDAGFCGFVERLGFEILEVSDAETLAGRDGVKTFVFRRRPIA